jgi:hypothetical protein
MNWHLDWTLMKNTADPFAWKVAQVVRENSDFSTQPQCMGMEKV